MKKAVSILLLLSLSSILLMSCDMEAPAASKPKSSSAPATSAEPQATPAAVNKVPDSAYDLSNPQVAAKYGKYLFLDKQALRAKLKQDFGEAPEEGTDHEEGSNYFKLPKAGLKFILTDEEDVPVSRIEVDSTVSQLNFAGAKGQMSFAEIMKRAGATLILSFGDECLISYPQNGFTVEFSSNHIYDNTAMMRIESSGVSDTIPEPRSPSKVELDEGAFSLPANWQGKVSLTFRDEATTISYNGQAHVYPLFELRQYSGEGWEETEKEKRQEQIVVAKSDEYLIAVTLPAEPDLAPEDRSSYQELQSEIPNVIQTLKLNGSGGKVYTDLNRTPCNESVISTMDLRRIEDAYKAYHDRTSFNYSEAGIDELYSDMAQCFADRNKQLLRDHSEISKGTKRLREAIDQLNSSWMSVQSLRDGGGTLYIHASIRSIGTNEAAFYIYLNKRLEKDKPSDSQKFQTALSKLQKTRDDYAAKKIEAFNLEDQSEMKPAVKDLVSAYDEVINIFNEKSQQDSAASAYLLEYLNQYDFEAEGE